MFVYLIKLSLLNDTDFPKDEIHPGIQSNEWLKSLVKKYEFSILGFTIQEFQDNVNSQETDDLSEYYIYFSEKELIWLKH